MKATDDVSTERSNTYSTRSEVLVVPLVPVVPVAIVGCTEEVVLVEVDGVSMETNE